MLIKYNIYKYALFILFQQILLKLTTLFTLNTIFTLSFVLKVLVVRPKVLCVSLFCKSEYTSFTAKRRTDQHSGISNKNGHEIRFL